MISGRKLALVSGILLISAEACAPRSDSRLARAVEAARAADSADGIKSDLEFLAADAREGRRTGTPGYLDAARYVAARFADLGLRPASDRGFYQSVRLVAATRTPKAARLSVKRADGAAVVLEPMQDFLIGRPLKRSEFGVEAPAVFVGYGIGQPESGLDDYAGVEVAGKIVVAMSGAPGFLNSEERAFYAGSRDKMKAAAARGAIGFITVPTAASETRSPWSRILNGADHPAMAWIGPDGAIDPEASPIEATAVLSAEGAAKLFNGAVQSYAELRQIEATGGELKAFQLPATIALAGASRIDRVSSPNVVALIVGADPALRNQAVVLSAHLDHLGRREPKRKGDDAVYNGALDNAIGAAILLDVAERLIAVPPERSVVFLVATGEEQGLLGADYFARHPPLAGKTIVADVNLDMPLLLYPFVDIVAFGAERSTLGPAVAAEAAAMGVKLSPDPFPEQGVFTRSDHYAFVRRGIPSTYLIPGFEQGGEAAFRDFYAARYHRPSDDLSQPIDYAAAARYSELNARIVRRIADADAPPSWKPGDFFGERFSVRKPE